MINIQIPNFTLQSDQTFFKTKFSTYRYSRIHYKYNALKKLLVQLLSKALL